MHASPTMTPDPDPTHNPRFGQARSLLASASPCSLCPEGAGFDRAAGMVVHLWFKNSTGIHWFRCEIAGTARRQDELCELSPMGDRRVELNLKSLELAHRNRSALTTTCRISSLQSEIAWWKYDGIWWKRGGNVVEMWWKKWWKREGRM